MIMIIGFHLETNVMIMLKVVSRLHIITFANACCHSLPKCGCYVDEF